MRYDPAKHHRQSIRLHGYDYTHAGAYFVTVCVQNRQCLFGDIVNDEMQLNEARRIVQAVWNKLSERFSSVKLDNFVVMPNHVHGIIVIVGAGLALPRNMGAASSAPTLGNIMRVFKSISAINVNRALMRMGQSLWQRNYFEHIIRKEDESIRIREYIVNNPLQWELDRENPAAEGRQAQELSLRRVESWQV